MFDRATSAAAEQAAKATLAACGLAPEQLAEAIRVCTLVAWRVAPLEELADRLEGEVGLEAAKASEVAGKLRAGALPAWQRLWSQLDEHEHGLNRADLHGRFDDWSQRLSAEVADHAAEFEQQPRMGLFLEENLDREHQWTGSAAIDFLAQRGRLVSTALQIRDLRDGFEGWLKGASSAQGAALPPSEQWNAPLVALLLQYLLEVRLEWSGEDAALIASVIGQHMAAAAHDHSYATVVFGNEAKNEFEWRPVKVANGRVEFTD